MHRIHSIQRKLNMFKYRRFLGAITPQLNSKYEGFYISSADSTLPRGLPSWRLRSLSMAVGLD
jgi:hypothetical protein